MKISVVVPIFNEAGNLKALVAELENALLPYWQDYEILLVDDGSTDGSAIEIRDIALSTSKVRSYSLSRNYGQTAAIAFGMSKARGEYLVTIDADLQNDPQDIPKMIERLESGYDFVAGWRVDRKDPFFRSFLSRVANRLISRYSSVSLHDYGCTLKAFRSSKLTQLRLFGEMHRFIPIYMDDIGAKMTEVPVNHRERTWGESKYGFGRIVKVLVDLIVVLFLRRYLSRPMHIFGMIGLWLHSISLICFSTALVLRISGYATLVQTPLPLLGSVFFVGGLMAWLLGLIAEILVRVMFNLEPSRAVNGHLVN